MNSLGVDPYVHSFYDDLRDGLVLIQVLYFSTSSINITGCIYLRGHRIWPVN